MTIIKLCSYFQLLLLYEFVIIKKKFHRVQQQKQKQKKFQITKEKNKQTIDCAVCSKLVKHDYREKYDL